MMEMFGEGGGLDWKDVADGLFNAFAALTVLITGKVMLAMLAFSARLTGLARLMGFLAATEAAKAAGSTVGGSVKGAITNKKLISRIGKLGVATGVGLGAYELATALGADDLGRWLGNKAFEIMNPSAMIPLSQRGAVPTTNNVTVTVNNPQSELDIERAIVNTFNGMVEQNMPVEQ
jgi:hypothetical protein